MNYKDLKERYLKEEAKYVEHFASQSWLKKKFMCAAAGAGLGLVGAGLILTTSPILGLAFTAAAIMATSNVVKKTGLRDWKEDMRTWDSFFNFGTLITTAIIASIGPLALSGQYEPAEPESIGPQSSYIEQDSNRTAPMASMAYRPA